MLVCLVIAIFAVGGAIAGDVAAGSAGNNTLHVRLAGLRSNNGHAHCTLFNSDAFPSDDSKAVKEADAPIKNQSAVCDFAGIPPAKYAVVAYHDENNNGKFDQNAIGMPKEGYAFSNNVRPRFSAPSFSDCAFDFKGGDQTITLNMIN